VAVLPISITGHPVLHSAAQPVSHITDDTRQLVADLVETMHAAPGVGLAAPQVGVGLQVFVWHFDDGDTLNEGHVLNPHLVVSGWPRNLFWGEAGEEGCLSVPGLRAPLARYPRARLTGITLDNTLVDVKANGWLARIFQHEYDHLRGVLYVDRLSRSWRRTLHQESLALGLGNTLTQWIPGVDGQEGDFVAPDDDADPSA
jgi:peptide deformylase